MNDGVLNEIELELFHTIFVIISALTKADPVFIVNYIIENIYPLTIDSCYEERVDEDGLCVICQEGLNNKMNLMEIRVCKHKFHKTCWREYKNVTTCPICQHRLIVPGKLQQMKIE